MFERLFAQLARATLTNLSKNNNCKQFTSRSMPFRILDRAVRVRGVVTSPVIKADTDAETVDVVFITNDGKRIATKGKVGENLLDVVINNNVDIDGFGACEGTCACSTCHLIFKKEDFDNIEGEMSNEELDMLDLAYELSDTSRLGCQVTLTKKLNGVEAKVPAGVLDARSSS